MKRIYLVILFAIFSISVVATPFDLRYPRALQNWESYAVIGDAGVRNSTTELLRRSLSVAKINNLILPGDNIYDTKSSYPMIWDIWKQEGFLFPIVAIGNHNIGYAAEVAYFKMPKEYYAVESKGALFLVLNSDNKNTYSEQTSWLDQTLKNSQYPLNFIVYHHPSVTLTSRHNWEERKAFQTNMRQIIKKYSSKITSLIVGHDHAAGLFMLDKTIPLILSGASWESLGLKLPAPKDPMFDVQGIWGSQKGGFWWVKLDYNVITREVYAHFVRFDRQQDVCTIRILPRPVANTRGCQL